MIKDYINVRVFVLLDLSLAATWILLSIGGWSVIKQYPQVDAIIWGIISVPLALIGVAMIYQRANLVHRKHVNIQHIYEQEQEIRLIHLRQQQSLPYPKDDYRIENEEDYETVSQQVGSGIPIRLAIPKSQDIPRGIHSQDETLQNCNAVVAQYLSDNPNMSMNQMIRATKYSRGTIGRTMAWRERSR